jgi:hypothetical protein
VHARLVAAGLALIVGAVDQVAHAQPQSPAPNDGAITAKIGVWRIDPLGIEPELVGRLESLFRMELDRLAAKPLPTRRDFERAVPSDLRDCTGEEKCLAAIGKKVNVEIMVSGSVGELGDNYVLNIKAVQVATATKIRSIASAPLRGSPDELIEAIRVAAYELLAPSQIHGSLQVETDLIGASVSLDGRLLGKTPLGAPAGRLPLGEHVLRVEAKGYEPFEDKVVIRFQKTTRVVVRLVTRENPNPGEPRVIVREKRPWYSRWYTMAAIGVVAVGIGAYVGWDIGSITRDEVKCPMGQSC